MRWPNLDWIYLLRLGNDLQVLERVLLPMLVNSLSRLTVNVVYMETLSDDCTQFVFTCKGRKKVFRVPVHIRLLTLVGRFAISCSTPGPTYTVASSQVADRGNAGER